MKKRIILLLAVLSAMSLATGCKKVKEISVTSFEIVSVTPSGLTELDALIKLGIHNPMVPFEVTDATGTLKIAGKPCISLSTDQLIVAGNTDKVYSIPIKGWIAEGFNPFELLKLFNGGSLDFDQLTVDVNGKVALRGGVGKKLDIKDIKLSKFSKKSNEETVDNNSGE